MNKDQFNKDVLTGLKKEKKTLPSKYFYDKIGDELFVRIMNLPEYYLTRSEHEIFKQQAPNFIAAFGIDKQTHFEIIELGAGDGSKTVELLKSLFLEAYNFEYTAIDISANTLDVLEENILAQIPKLKLNKLAGDYFDKLAILKQSKHPKIILFLGSNIGNLSDEESSKFLTQIGENLNDGDQLVLGLDLKKSKDIVLPAYSDKEGVTKAFNLNLLHRINTTLSADFDLKQFDHVAEYEFEEGIARSFIVSKKKQAVTFNYSNETIYFNENERIHTEISRKYDDEILRKILKPTAFKIAAKLLDKQQFFADYILEKQ